MDFTNIFQLKGPKLKNKGQTNFYECCDLTKKLYLMYFYVLSTTTKRKKHMIGKWYSTKIQTRPTFNWAPSVATYLYEYDVHFNIDFSLNSWFDIWKRTPQKNEIIHQTSLKNQIWHFKNKCSCILHLVCLACLI